MEVDQNAFYNALLDRTNSKLNQLQVQVNMLETQLHFASELNKSLQQELDKLKKRKEKNTSDDFSQPS